MVFAASYKKKKNKVPAGSLTVEGIKRKIENGLAADAGTTKIKSRDPIYHITESFISSFDNTGRNKAEILGGYSKSALPIDSAEVLSSTNFMAGFQPGKTEEPQREKNAETGDTLSGQRTLQDQMTGELFYRRFSETAFRNGRLASAVLQGNGKTMFISCLKRALGQSEPQNSLQSKLFVGSSPDMPVKNTLGRVIFNRYAKSAIGLVADSTMTARQTLQMFERLVSEDAGEAVPGLKAETAETLRVMYPFLDISKEKERLEEYREMMLQLTLQEQSSGAHEELKDIAEKKSLLNVGMTKTTALIARKRQMQKQFFDHLEMLLENSKKAEEMFASPGFAEEVVEELLGPAEPPADDDGEGKGKKGRKPEAEPKDSEEPPK